MITSRQRPLPSPQQRTPVPAPVPVPVPSIAGERYDAAVRRRRRRRAPSTMLNRYVAALLNRDRAASDAAWTIPPGDPRQQTTPRCGSFRTCARCACTAIPRSPEMTGSHRGCLKSLRSVRSPPMARSASAAGTACAQQRRQRLADPVGTAASNAGLNRCSGMHARFSLRGYSLIHPSASHRSPTCACVP